MSKIVIGMHGLANKPPKNILESWWKKAINEGLAKNLGVEIDFEFSMIYWADLYYKYPLHHDTNYEFDSLFNSEPYVEALENTLKCYEDGWLERLRIESKTTENHVLKILKQNFDIESTADYLLSKFFKDLHFYYSGKKFRDRKGVHKPIKEILIEELHKEIRSQNEKSILLISHSMGTIVAFDALHCAPSNLTIDHFITLGSPLGIDHVKMKAASSGTPLTKPNCVRKWTNYSDKKDPIALDPHLADDYGKDVCDVMVLNDYQINEKRNYHKSYGYLRTPEISQYICRFLNE